METTAAFRGLACRDCGTTHAIEDVAGRCPDCGGLLTPAFDNADVVEPPAAERGAPRSMWDLDRFLPVPASAAVTMGEGGTPLVACPALAEELGVGRVLIKDEGRNPTGSVADRGLSLAVSVAAATGATDVALPSAGADGHAAAAYAARAGLDAHVVVPSRTGFARKAMINVHGGDMTVVEGRLPEAAAACEDALRDHPDWRPVAPFETPYRHAAAGTVLHEVVSELDGAPDAVVHPTGAGTGIVGSYVAATTLRDLGVLDELPRLYAAQASGCAPIVRAVEGAAPVRPWERPDTIAGSIEVPDPPGGDWAVEAVRESGGDAVATEDPDLLESAVTIAAHEGVSMAPGSAAAASGAWALAERGAFDADDTVVLVNATGGLASPDVLRSHLMGQGV